ncbi:hypothetical protein CAL29_03510 [Bordetella genomosp. 10]|uniref:Porin domain-containing protein n=1 Tax=Bordetella genomosp. 10 TaxID=1416804 RepID=A0A261SKF6_9BORD|nr:porin [Bordetella genomosp. 10]OZI37487.1 hypothetical protein CAL29_03510 [Bordetella genomosp. 10]
MKRYPLAFAIAASSVSMPAHSASEVKLYGTLDAGYQYLHIKGLGASNGMISGGQGASKFGLRGSEDLGDGLRVNFQLEGGFNAANGKGTPPERGVFGRTTWLGLEGGFGEFRMGRQTLAASAMTDIFSPFGASYRLAGAGSAINSNTTPRADNTLKFITADLGGFQATASYSFDAHLAQNKDGLHPSLLGKDARDRVFSGAASYGGAAWKVAAYYQETSLESRTSTRGMHYDVSPREYGLGGKASFGPATLHAGWAQHRDAYINGVHPNNLGQAAVFRGGLVNGYTLGASYETGAGKLLGQVQWNAPNRNVRRFGKRAHDQKVYSLGYSHDLSKRTNVYTYVAYLDGAWFDKEWNATQFIVGMQHRF